MVAATLVGCSSESATELDDYLEGLEFGKPTEEMVEVSLGNFRVPLTGSTPGMQQESDWMELKFQLFVVVPPSEKQEVLRTMEDHRGAVRDSVFRICRSISLDELSDPRLTTFKTRLTDAVRPIIGEERVRQILVIDVVSEVL